MPLCSAHHHKHHRGVFAITRDDGTIRFTGPDGTTVGLANPTLPGLLAPLRATA